MNLFLVLFLRNDTTKIGLWVVLAREGLCEKGAYFESQLMPLPDTMDFQTAAGTRVVYPREHIEKRADENAAGEPNAVIFLSKRPASLKL